MSADWLIYGANGYTGRLLAELAVARGHRPVLAGRDAAAIGAMADRLGLAHRVFRLSEPQGVRDGLADMAAVVHCAGPFEVTAEPMANGCLATGTHYLDITGEIAVLERIYRMGHYAQTVSVALVPAVGFDVVPTDCLAAMLAAALPTATHLELAFVAGGGLSPGTFLTSLRGMAGGNLRRVEGILRQIPMGGPTREVPLPSGHRVVTAIPWGDLASAYRSTGIPNITTYTRVVRSGTPARVVAGALRLGPVHAAVRKLANPTGPDAVRRSRTRSEVWGEVRDGDGNTRTATLIGPNGYSLTADAALRAVLHVLDGKVPPGAHTPSSAFGADFVRELDGVTISAIS